MNKLVQPGNSVATASVDATALKEANATRPQAIAGATLASTETDVRNLIQSTLAGTGTTASTATRNVISKSASVCEPQKPSVSVR